MKTLSTTGMGGPVISLKSDSRKNQMCIVWLSIDSPEQPIDYYQLLINGEKKQLVRLLIFKFKIYEFQSKQYTKYTKTKIICF